jgi:hypothetical protein
VASSQLEIDLRPALWTTVVEAVGKDDQLTSLRRKDLFYIDIRFFKELPNTTCSRYGSAED